MTRVRRTDAAPATHVSKRLRGGRRAESVSITAAAPSLHDDLGGRMRRYWLLMGLRVAFLASMAVVPRQWWWLCIVCALTAPLLAVLVANAGREGGGPTPAEHAGQGLVRLDAPDDGPEQTGEPRRRPTYHVRPGEFLR